MIPDIEDREVGGDHPRLHEPVSFRSRDRRVKRRLLHLRGHGTDGDRKEGESRREHREARSRPAVHDALSLPNGGPAAQTLARTASFTVIFAFFFSSALNVSTAF